MRKIISCLLALMMFLSAVVFSGCTEEEINVAELAEAELRVYFSALGGFNMKAMNDCVEGEDDSDIGFSTENISYEYVQTDKYKSSVKEMYRALARTLEFKINSKEVTDDKIVFDVKLKYADVEEESMVKYTNSKVDEYVEKNPVFFTYDEVKQNDVAITVMAQAYEEYLQITERLEKDFKITMTQDEGSFKIRTEDNREFFDFLADLFG